MNERMEGPRGSSVTFDVEKGLGINLIRYNATEDNDWRWLVKCLSLLSNVFLCGEARAENSMYHTSTAVQLGARLDRECGV